MSGNKLAHSDLANMAAPAAAARRRFIPEPARTWVYVTAVLAILVAKGAILLAMGSNLVCPCGVQLWLNDSTGRENSQHFADWYSFSHVIAGMLFAWVMWLKSRGWPLGWMIVAAAAFSAGWETVENTPWIIAQFGDTDLGAHYAGDTILNSMSDSLFVLIGFVAALRLPLLATTGIALAAEVAAGVMIGDNLVLSVVRFLVGLLPS